MKSLCLSLLAIIVAVSFYSCKNGELVGKTKVIEDSLITIFPTWQSAKIGLHDNYTNVTVVIGDATFYKAADDVKKAKAIELGKMILRVCGKDNTLETGSLTVTADVINQSESPADGIKVPIDIEGLRRSMQ